MAVTIYLVSMFFSAVVIGCVYNNLLTPKLNRAFSVLIFAVLFLAIFTVANYSEIYKTLIPDFQEQQAIKSIAMLVLCLVYPLVLFKDSIKNRVKLFIVLILCVYTVEALFSALLSITLDFDAVEFNTSESLEIRLIASITSLVIYSIASVLTYFIYKRNKIKLSKPMLISIVSIILINCVMLSFIFSVTVDSKDMLTKIILLVSPLLLILLSAIMYKMMLKLNETEVMKEKLYWVENVKGMELEYYNKLQEKTNEVRKIRHDFKDNLETAKLLIKENSEESIEKASEIISAMEKSINATKLPVYTENVVVNAIVGAKAEEASKKGITLETQIDVPKELSIESIDLNCVFLNLLNNAIEATEKLEKTEKTISLRSEIKAGYLFVKVENEFNELETNSAGELITTKEDKENHGIGTSLLSEIAKKYDGQFETEQKENKFIAVVSMKI